MSGSACSPAAAAPHCRGSRPCTPSSTGATACSATRRNCCSRAYRCSSAAPPWSRLRRSSPARSWRGNKCPTCCCRWWRNPWCMPIPAPRRRATGCSNRRDTMRSKSSPPAATFAGGTPGTSRPGSGRRRRSGRPPRRRNGWRATNPTSTTCAAHWNGRSGRTAMPPSESIWSGHSHVLWAELAAMPEHRHWVELALGKTDQRTPVGRGSAAVVLAGRGRARARRSRRLRRGDARGEPLPQARRPLSRGARVAAGGNGAAVAGQRRRGRAAPGPSLCAGQAARRDQDDGALPERAGLGASVRRRSR